MATERWPELVGTVAAIAVFVAAASLDAVVGLIGRGRLRELADGPGGWRRTVENLLGPRRALTAALVTVQAITLAMAASLLTVVFAEAPGWGEHALAIAIVLVVYASGGLAVPRVLRRFRRDDPPPSVSWPASGFEMLAKPVLATGDALAAWFERLLPASAVSQPASVGFEEELVPFLGGEGSQGAIEPAERAMIQGILDLEDLTVREIMVPRVDVVAIELEVPAEELVATIVRAGHSRIPVYRESIDQIVGILYAKDLIPFVLEVTTEVSLADLVRPPFVVPDSKRVDTLLREMRRTRTHLAIVADEYGGTAGLVTIEDILEEIVGEIQDEYDTETPLIERLGDGVFVLDARLPLAEVEEVLGARFPEDADFETLGGYVQSELARLPREGDRFSDPVVGLEVEILGVEGRRIRRVRLVRSIRSDTESSGSTGSSQSGVSSRSANGQDQGEREAQHDGSTAAGNPAEVATSSSSEE